MRLRDCLGRPFCFDNANIRSVREACVLLQCLQVGYSEIPPNSTWNTQWKNISLQRVRYEKYNTDLTADYLILGFLLLLPDFIRPSNPTYVIYCNKPTCVQMQHPGCHGIAIGRGHSASYCGSLYLL